ncbi:Pleckstrin y domain-containing protein [Schizosaccharomyces pombe]
MAAPANASSKKDHVIPVLLNECSIDSPSFRASMYYLGNQIKAFNEWSHDFLCCCNKFIESIMAIEPIVASMSLNAMPSNVASGFFDPDYATTALLHGQDLFRSSYMVQLQQAKNLRKFIVAPLDLFRDSKVKPLLQLNDRFKAEQAKYDAEVLRYSSLGHSKDLSQMRDEAKSLYEARKSYFTVALQYVVRVTSFRSSIDFIVIESICKFSIETFRLTDRLHESNRHINDQLIRLLSYETKLKESYPSLKRIVSNVFDRIEKEILKRVQPPTNLDAYRFDPQQICQTNATKRQGWLLRNISSSKADNKAIWRKYWFFVDNGYVGYLINDANGGVFESEKIGVLLCKFSVLPSNHRKFCFQIKTKSVSYILQAETHMEMLEWGSVINNAREHCINSGISANRILSPTLPSFSAKATSIINPQVNGRSNSTGKIGKNYRPRRTYSGRLLCGPNNYEVSTIMRSPTISTVPPPKYLSNSINGAKFLNPLAPWTLVNAPLITNLTHETITSLLDQEAFFHGNSPCALLANFWGSVNYGHVLERQNVYIEDLSNPSYKRLAREIHIEKLPSELKLRNAEFRGIFGESEASTVLFVCRVCSKREDQIRMPGRMYCTMKGIYIYYNINGLVLIEHFPISSILNVKQFTSTKCDYFYMNIQNIGTVRFRLYLDSSKALTDRLNVLLCNYIADKPNSSIQLLSCIKRLNDDAKRFERGGDDNALKSYGVQPSQEDLLIRRGRSSRALTNLINKNESNDSFMEDLRDFKIAMLPKETVQVVRSHHLDDIVFDRVYNVSTKALFHIVFGDRSTVLSGAYNLHGVDDVEFLPWGKDPKTNLSRRYINYKVYNYDQEGQCQSYHYEDCQIMDVRNDYHLYIMTWLHHSWTLPYRDYFKIVTKTSISHLRREKSRLLISVGLEWIVKPFAISKVIEAECRKLAIKYIKTEVNFLEKATRRARNQPLIAIINQYGRVGDYNESMVYRRKIPFNCELKNLSIIDIIRNNWWLFLQGLAIDLLKLPWAVFHIFLRYLFSHSFLVIIFACSVILNLSLMFCFGAKYWDERQNNKFVGQVFDEFKNIETSARYVYMKDVDDLLVGLPTYLHPNVTYPSECLQSFALKSSPQKSHWLRKRNYIAEKRKKILENLASLNYYEYIIHEDAVYQYIQQELLGCDKAREFDLYPPSMQRYCDSCTQDWRNRTLFFGKDTLATRLLTLETVENADYAA